MIRRIGLPLALAAVLAGSVDAAPPAKLPETTAQLERKRIGTELAVPHHLGDDEELNMSVSGLLTFGRMLFMANWTEQDGAGRPQTKGNGKALTDPGTPLKGQRAFNRISGPDANSCYGCHNQPHGIAGGHGDFAANVWVQAQRFDFATFDETDKAPTRGALDEDRRPVTAATIGNVRSSTGMFGAGYIELLAREMTAELQIIRDSLKLGETKPLTAKGISFGQLTREANGSWNLSKVEGLPRMSILAPTPVDRPNLILRPWHAAGNAVSIREFTSTALNQHHGIQSTERFGRDTDPDGDGVTNEMTRGDLTALSLFQASLQVPGRVIPNDPEIERAVLNGERQFKAMGCESCHVSTLTLNSPVYSEPNPFNPPLNLRTGETRAVEMDLTSAQLPVPRLLPEGGKITVAAYTDLKLHDLGKEGAEPLDMNQTSWTKPYSKGNQKFLTKRLWGCANQPPYFHHGQFTTLRQSVLAHGGEGTPSLRNFQDASEYDQDSLIEFLKSLQVLPPGTRDLIVDENFKKKVWPPRSL